MLNVHSPKMSSLQMRLLTCCSDELMRVLCSNMGLETGVWSVLVHWLVHGGNSVGAPKRGWTLFLEQLARRQARAFHFLDHRCGASRLMQAAFKDAQQFNWLISYQKYQCLNGLNSARKGHAIASCSAMSDSGCF